MIEGRPRIKSEVGNKKTPAAVRPPGLPVFRVGYFA